MSVWQVQDVYQTLDSAELAHQLLPQYKEVATSLLLVILLLREAFRQIKLVIVDRLFHGVAE